MIYITAVHMEPSYGSSYEHIARLQWTEFGTDLDGDSTREQVIEWINNGVDARVQDRWGDVRVDVVNADPPHLRTYRDNRETDNLLSLPRY